MTKRGTAGESERPRVPGRTSAQVDHHRNVAEQQTRPPAPHREDPRRSREKIRELEMRRETGTITGVNTDTVEARLTHRLTNIAARRVRERTLRRYESTIRMHIVPHIGGQRLSKLQPEHLEQLHHLLVEQGLFPPACGTSGSTTGGEQLAGGDGTTRPHPDPRHAKGLAAC